VIIEKIKGKVGAASSIESSDVVLGTCHKMKGLEAPNVLLDDDFIELCEFTEMLNKATPGEKAEQLRKANEELNILYVGITRAKKVLQLNLDLLSYFAGQHDDDEY
jgi:superfamily I DNA/RNA helicase